MSIEKRKTDKKGNLFYLCCDVCGEEAEPQGFEEFNDAVAYKKENGWKSIKHLGEWEDVCPECQHGREI